MKIVTASTVKSRVKENEKPLQGGEIHENNQQELFRDSMHYQVEHMLRCGDPLICIRKEVEELLGDVPNVNPRKTIMRARKRIRATA